MSAITKGGNTMRIILATVGALGVSLISVAGVSAIPMNAASINAAAGADSPIMKAVTGGAHHLGRWPSCQHLNSYNPKTRTFIGSNGKQHPCVPPHGH
jgi:BA14K-like protein